MSRSSRMLTYINYRMRITLQDSRTLVGTFMAFDRHMNMVLGDTEEYRRIKSKKGSGITEEKLEKRVLGLIILRGDSVVSMTIEGPPPPEGDEKAQPGGPGVGKAAGRGLPIAPPTGAPIGLSGPVRGVGGPSSMMMQPPSQVAAMAQAGMSMMGRGPPPPMPGMGMPMPGMGMGMPGMPPRGMPGMPMPMPGMPGMPPRGMPGMPMPMSGMPGMPPPPGGMGMGMGFPPRPPGM